MKEIHIKYKCNDTAVVKIDELSGKWIITKIKSLRRIVISIISIYFLFIHFIEAKSEEVESGWKCHSNGSMGNGE